MEPKIITYLREIPIGTHGYIVGYDQVFGGYRGKLSSIGLIPGTEFILIRHGSIIVPLIIEVKGNLLRLSKPEADALCIEI
ncbi:MAG TPA: ferrous iron transport protein A [Cyanothece sp. UBA12306]|nr:ferrous iron transport protein A [Cyanothece sp. UBA12306]